MRLQFVAQGLIAGAGRIQERTAFPDRPFDALVIDALARRSPISFRHGFPASFLVDARFDGNARTTVADVHVLFIQFLKGAHC
jgi:hypothetical protein